MVSMLPATEPDVFRIRGGNGLLPPALLAAANASVRCPSPVGAIHRRADGRFELHAGAPPTGRAPEEGGGAQHEQPAARQGGPGAAALAAGQPLGTYDAVIIATPLEGSGIVLAGFEPPHLPARKYRQVGPSSYCLYLHRRPPMRTEAASPEGAAFGQAAAATAALPVLLPSLPASPCCGPAPAYQPTAPPSITDGDHLCARLGAGLVLWAGRDDLL